MPRPSRARSLRQTAFGGSLGAFALALTPVALVAPAQAAARRVALRDGSVLIGEVVDPSADPVVVRTDWGGVRVPAASVPWQRPRSDGMPASVDGIDLPSAHVPPARTWGVSGWSLGVVPVERLWVAIDVAELGGLNQRLRPDPHASERPRAGRPAPARRARGRGRARRDRR